MYLALIASTHFMQRPGRSTRKCVNYREDIEEFSDIEMLDGPESEEDSTPAPKRARIETPLSELFKMKTVFELDPYVKREPPAEVSFK